jgi:hypothetical protein
MPRRANNRADGHTRGDGSAKAGYRDWYAASSAAREAQRAHQIEVHVYRCDVCGLFHKGRPQRRRSRSSGGWK